MTIDQPMLPQVPRTTPAQPLQVLSGLVMLWTCLMLEWLTIAIRLRPRQLRGLIDRKGDIA